MERTAFEASPVDGDTVDRQGLAEPLNTDGVAINHYRIAPGEGFPSGLHTHADQEEVFLVLDGTATFEVLDDALGSDPDRPRTGRAVTVDAGEAIRFAPGEYQSGDNRGDEPLVTLAVGAPRDTTDVRVPVSCPDCGDADFALDTGGDTLSFVCPACGAERVPAPCPDCGADAMGLTLDDAGVAVAACGDCGATFETPPYRE